MQCFHTPFKSYLSNVKYVKIQKLVYVSQYLSPSFCQRGNTAQLHLKFFLGYKDVLCSWESGSYIILDTVVDLGALCLEGKMDCAVTGVTSDNQLWRLSPPHLLLSAWSLPSMSVCPLHLKVPIQILQPLSSQSLMLYSRK